MRPRNQLLAACPWLTRDDASEALRHAGGDVEKAKRASSARRRCEEEDPEGCDTGDAARRRQNGEEGDGAQNDERGSTGKLHAQNEDDDKKQSSSPIARAPPRHSASINNLSDRQYCCVWGVEVYEDGYRPDVARTLLANVARHVNPILRARGWRVKRLIESASTQWIGLCTTNGRSDADAASTNIQLNLRVRPDKRCKEFRSFHQVLAVMLHEITHTSIGLEDIHPPAFWELLDEIKKEYREKLAAGEVDLEKDDYGCKGQYISSSGSLASVATSASDILGANGTNTLGTLGASGSERDCGAKKKRRRRWNGKRGGGGNYSKGYKSNVPKKRPLLKGKKMVDKRTKAGKAAMAEAKNMSARDLAARAALARFGSMESTAKESESSGPEVHSLDDSESEDSEDERRSNNGKGDAFDDEEDDDDEPIREHNEKCGCRSCDWSKLFLLE
ncbi:hypothetical protein ACHAXT_001061 [Thalassiosira profunda]